MLHPQSIVGATPIIVLPPPDETKGPNSVAEQFKIRDKYRAGVSRLISALCFEGATALDATTAAQVHNCLAGSLLMCDALGAPAPSLDCALSRPPCLLLLARPLHLALPCCGRRYSAAVSACDISLTCPRMHVGTQARTQSVIDPLQTLKTRQPSGTSSSPSNSTLHPVFLSSYPPSPLSLLPWVQARP